MCMTERITRNERITMKRFGMPQENAYDVYDSKGELKYDSIERFYIYFKNVNFKADGVIEGTYLGLTDGSMSDGYSRSIRYNDEDNAWKMKNTKTVKTARLVSLNNKTGVTIIINNEKW